MGRSNLWKIISFKKIKPYILVLPLFLTKTGVISRLFYNIGIIKNFSEFPQLIFDQKGIGILCVYIFKGVPFVALFIMSVMSKISDKYNGVARSLGAKNLAILRKIYVPLSANAIIWSSSIIFTYDLGSFEVPYLLSSASRVPLSSELFSLYINPDISYIPRTMAMNLIIFVIGIIVAIVYAIILKLILVRRH